MAACARAAPLVALEVGTHDVGVRREADRIERITGSQSHRPPATQPTKHARNKSTLAQKDLTNTIDRINADVVQRKLGLLQRRVDVAGETAAHG